MSAGAHYVAYLESLGTVGTYTGSPRTLFRDRMPETPNVCGVVYESGGAPPTPGFGVAGIVAESPTLQVRFRGEPYDSEGPHDQARLAYLASQRVGVTLSSTFYRTMRPMQPPFLFDRDKNERVVWAFNVAIEKDV